MTESMATKNEWAQQNLLSLRAHPPFSFMYGGQPSADRLSSWKKTMMTAWLDENRTEYVLTWTDSATGLEVRCRAVDYTDFPVVEWTLHLINTGQGDTPILTDVQGMDLSFQGTDKDGFILRTVRGDDCSPASYQPIELTVKEGASYQFVPVGGRPTTGAFPYFNVGWDGRGVIAVLGWPGQWRARFECDQSQWLRIVGGQERTNLKLQPGEEIRTPLSVLMFWEGNAVDAQNLWRRWFIKHNLPRPGGRLMEPQLSASANDWSPGLCGNAADEIRFIETFARHGIQFDAWWTDAGWYPCEGNWSKTGTWEVDRTRYPQGLRAVADCAHANGLKFLVWFEPERVMPETRLDREHPEWLLSVEGEKTKLLNLGNPDARAWLTDHIDAFITREGIDVYRQDFNMDPLPFWRAHDAADRQGMTENRHVQGYLAYWDELQRRHPNLPIDSCASGGRRNDLETMRRGIPISKSDCTCDPLTVQCQLYGLAAWLPYFGSGAGLDFGDEYRFRSNIAPWTGAGYDARDAKLDYEALRRRIRLWRQNVPYFFGDYYPLTSYNLSPTVWMAWQFNRPETGDGLVQVFRREKSPYVSAKFKLLCLAPNADYVVTNLDASDAPIEMTGKALMETGLDVTVPHQPQAVFFRYHKKTGRHRTGHLRKKLG